MCYIEIVGHMCLFVIWTCITCKYCLHYQIGRTRLIKWFLLIQRHIYIIEIICHTNTYHYHKLSKPFYQQTFVDQTIYTAFVCQTCEQEQKKDLYLHNLMIIPENWVSMIFLSGVEPKLVPHLTVSSSILVHICLDQIRLAAPIPQELKI